MNTIRIILFFWTLLFVNLINFAFGDSEQPSNLESISREQNSLVNGLTLGRLTESEAIKAVATATKTPPRKMDKFGHKRWKEFKSPSKDRIVFNWIRQEGPKEHFVQLFSFWIRTPEAEFAETDVETAAAQFGMSVYAADDCTLYLNGKEIKESKSQKIDYRMLLDFENLPTKNGWNHILFKIRSEHLGTDKPGTLAIRLRSNRPELLKELESTVQIGVSPEEKAMNPGPRGVHPEAKAVDPSTLHGKLMCGYQGWFRAEGDGSGRGFQHYNGQGGKFEPGCCSIDLWPDMSEYDEDERFPTFFKHADGSTAYVFSSHVEKTVVRHFSWMERYGLDGVFLQRFVGGVRNEQNREDLRVVMENVRTGAARHGRAWAMMYDLSGIGENVLVPLLTEDWKRLVDENEIRKDAMYLHHKGKPVVTIWGVGFNDHRKYTLKECLELVTFLKDDPKYGGNTVMLGVPTYWRELHRDAANDPLLHEIIRKADIVSPWTVGRYGSVEQAKNYIEKTAAADAAWCRENGVEFFPVVFPGFSWHNLMKNRGQEAKPNAIPRLKGEFLTEQIKGHLANDSRMIYQAMFDEIDEATAIFKCTNDPPTGDSPFIDYEGLPSDFYLKRLGKASEALKRNVLKSNENSANDRESNSGR